MAAYYPKWHKIIRSQQVKELSQQVWDQENENLQKTLIRFRIFVLSVWEIVTVIYQNVTGLKE